MSEEMETNNASIECRQQQVSQQVTLDYIHSKQSQQNSGQNYIHSKVVSKIKLPSQQLRQVQTTSACGLFILSTIRWQTYSLFITHSNEFDARLLQLGAQLNNRKSNDTEGILYTLKHITTKMYSTSKL